MRSSLLGLLAFAISTAGLVTATPVYANQTLARRKADPPTCITDKDNKPKNCKGLMDLIKQRRTENGKRGLVGNDPRYVCTDDCCITWSGDTKYTWQDMFDLYHALRRPCPKTAAKQVDPTYGVAACLGKPGHDCEFDAATDTKYFFDEGKHKVCPNGCYYEVTYDQNAINVYAIGGSGAGYDTHREKDQEVWSIEQLASKALEQCADGRACQGETEYKADSWKYYCGKPGGNCHQLSSYNKDDMGRYDVTATMEFQQVHNNAAGVSVPNKLIEVMNAAVNVSARSDAEYKLVKGDYDDYNRLVYQTIPASIKVQLWRQDKGDGDTPVGSLTMHFKSCRDTTTSPFCNTATSFLDMAGTFFPIIGFAGTAMSLGCGGATTPNCK